MESLPVLLLVNTSIPDLANTESKTYTIYLQFIKNEKLLNRFLSHVPYLELFSHKRFVF